MRLSLSPSSARTLFAYFMKERGRPRPRLSEAVTTRGRGRPRSFTNWPVRQGVRDSSAGSVGNPRMNPLFEIYDGVKSLFVGMGITIGQFFRPTVTVHYPHETLKIPARFRGHIELVRDPATGNRKCCVCKLCAKA